MKPLMHLLALLFALAQTGCESCSQKTVEKAFAGKEYIFVTNTYEPLIQKEANLFTSLYPDAHLSVVKTSTEEALVHFLNDSVQLICIDRTLTEEEAALVQQYAIPVDTTPIAYDALAIVVHTYNPIQKITQSSLRKILTGKATNWRQIAEAQWAGTIDVVLPNKHSGIYALLQKKFFPTQSELAATTICTTDEEILGTVAKKPQALGVVSFYATRHLPAEIKVLAVEAPVDTLPGSFLKPTQENIYKQLYPFCYSLYLYTRGKKSKVGLGFGTFLLTYSGQKVFQDSGSVPIKIPSRPIQLTVE